MKKISLFLMAIFMMVAASAQKITEVGSFTNPLKLSNAKSIDTLAPPYWYSGLACADTLTYYSITNGYLTGNGGFGSTNVITEVGEGYNAIGSVTGVLAFITRTDGGSGSLTAKIYNTESGTFIPTGTPIQTSSAVQMSSISNTEFDLVMFTFPTPATVNGNFAATITFSTVAGDTAVVAGGRMGCVDAANDDHAVLNLAGTWATYKSLLEASSYPSIDLSILAIIDGVSGVSENKSTFSIYPNPANNMFAIATTEKVNTVRMYNVFGQLIYESTNAQNLSVVNTESFANGAYFVTVETTKGKSTQKLMISK